MATVKHCDKCGAVMEGDSAVMIRRKRKCWNQFDGEYTQTKNITYDVCERCAREIELDFVGEDEIDMATAQE